jgi:hypothetical protein
MSCANFHKVNARKYFIACYESSAEEYNDFECQCFYDDIENSFSERLKNEKNCREISIFDNYDDSSFRESKCLGLVLSNEIQIGKRVLCVEIIPYLNGGYYYGGNADYSICVHFDDGSVLENDDICESNVYDILSDFYYYDNKGMAKLQKKRYIQKIEEQIENLNEQFEIICKDLFEQYVSIGRFSNGEEIYEKIK